MSVSQPEMLKRPIPRTGEMISAVGFGTYSVFDVGQSKIDRDPLKEVLRLFAEAGSGMVDSSPMYGSAERVVGDLAGELGVRDSLFLATKVWTMGRETGIRQMEDSLRLLHTNVIDLMQVHNLMDWEAHFETLRAWKEQGRIRYTGITHYATSAFNAMERVMKAAYPDFIQIYYSIATRQAEERLLPLAADLGIGVIVNRPFETADLFGRVRGKRLPAWTEEFACTSWAQFFLKFILSHPTVTCAIPATGSAAHLMDNRKAGSGPLPDVRTRKKMLQYVDSL
jgi:aryl-alcohol dehydrogenase-like predicted oxidoreductase